MGYNSDMHAPQTIVELKGYLSEAQKLFTEEEMEDIKVSIASDPTAGVLMQNTGGVRKIRVARDGRGKSGGARVIYFFGGDEIPIFLLTVFAKNEKANLSKADCNALAKLTRELRDLYGAIS